MDKAGLKVTQHNLNVLLRASIPPKGGKSGGRPWSIGRFTMIMSLVIAGLISYVGVALALPPEILPFPVPSIYLFASATPRPSYPPTSTKTFIPTPTHTRTPTPTKSPTRTPTRRPTITRTSTRTPSLTPCIPMFTLTRGAFVRTGPGTAYPDITAIPAGDTVEIIDRNADGTWYYIFWQKFNVMGWISSITGRPTCDSPEAPIQPPLNPASGPSPTNVPDLPTSTNTPNPPPKFYDPSMSSNHLSCDDPETIKVLVTDPSGVARVDFHYWVIDQSTNQTVYQLSLPMQFVEAGLFSHWAIEFAAPTIQDYPIKNYWFRFAFTATDNVGVQTQSTAYVITFTSCIPPPA